uniref:Methyltransferase 15, mitochondrial 12S rRNA N4-cytidine n=1 Tax=Oncorhynchus mykiss TaxID=8022 RepID=A0A8C7RKC1_ONCMY
MTFSQSSSGSSKCSLANFRRAWTCTGLSRGTRLSLQDLSPWRRSVLLMVGFVTLVPALCRSFTRSPRVFLNLSFGGGGHTKAILRSSPEVTVVALDRDPAAFSLAQQLAKEHSCLVHPLLGRFSELGALLSRLRLQPGSVDAVLLDAGLSSMQMDCPERGFSLSKNGPLDMRMDADRYPDMPCAADVVNALDQQALLCAISLPLGSFAASALYARKDRLQRPSHAATKTFQALRMFTVLKPGGRLCVLTFHSLEDRLVKRFLHGEDVGAPPRWSGRQRVQRWEEEEEEEEKDGEKDSGHWVDLQRGVLMPQAEDVLENPRGRSAKLRAAFKQ